MGGLILESYVETSGVGALTFEQLIEHYAGGVTHYVRAYDSKTKQEVLRPAAAPRIIKFVTRLVEVQLSDGGSFTAAVDQKIMELTMGRYIEAQDLMFSDVVKRGANVMRITHLNPSDPVPVYGFTVPDVCNFRLGCGLIAHSSG